MVPKQTSHCVTSYTGLLKPVVDSVFSFDDALKAYDRLMSRRATGKVVVKVEPLIE
jgi:NADPH:quinone reductase-like Zn-dependent oxidoreductase